MAKNGDGPQNVSDLAEKLGFDPVLLGELLRLVLSTITCLLRRKCPHTYNLALTQLGLELS